MIRERMANASQGRPEIGAKIGAKIKEVLPAARTGAWSELVDGRVEIAGVVLDKADFEMRLITDEGVGQSRSHAAWASRCSDTAFDALLQAEGWPRDFVRLVQNARKDAGLTVTDRITLTARLRSLLAEAVKLLRRVCRRGDVEHQYGFRL